MTELDPSACYRAVQARDVRFDGRFFTGVKTTRIYCRSICPARTPKSQNCCFFISAAAAQEAGFRPCLRCRPEISPDLSRWHGTSVTVTRALDLIADGALDGESTVDALAVRLGVGERHLRRLFFEHVGASPISVAQTRRFLFAKQLIHDTQLPLSDIAFAAGFGSIRRFNAAFRAGYKRSPRELRRTRLESDRCGSVRLVIPYQQPYDFEGVLRFLRARSIAGLEFVGSDRYIRTFDVGNSTGIVEVMNRPERGVLDTSISCANMRVLASVMRRISRVFDTQTDIGVVSRHLARDPELSALIRQRPGLRIPGGWDGFELAVRAILGQQITVDGARNLAVKLVARFGRPIIGLAAERHGLIQPGLIQPGLIQPGLPQHDLTHTFPSPEALASADVASLGMPRKRAAALQSLAKAVAEDPNFFDRAQSLESAIERLRSLPGVGEWTAQYIALRALRETDAFPHSDIGLLRGLATDGVRPNPSALLARAEQWRPWRAYAAQHLWAKDENNHATKTRFLPRYSSNSTRLTDNHY